MAVQISGNDITVPRDGTFTRNVTIGGTLTYEDVTNIDSVGLVTARTGIEIGARPGVAASISVDGNMIISGISTFGGDIQVPDKIIHAGDTNTAIRFPAADTITAETGGSERLRVDGSGRLLIGTSTNNAHANADNAVISGTGNIGLSIMSTDSGRSSIYFGDSSSSPGSYAGFIDFIHSSNSFNVGRGNDNSLTIDSSGRVIIGGTSPLTDAQLTISADDAPAMAFQRSGSGRFEAAIGMETNSALRFYVGADSSTVSGLTEAMQVDASGRLLVGTTTEGNTNADDLTVANSGEGGITIRTGSSSNGNIFFSDATSGAGEYAGIIDYKHGSDAMTFGTSGSERYRIHSNGTQSWGNTTFPYNEHYHFYTGISGKAGMSLYFGTDTDEPGFIMRHGRSGANSGAYTGKLFQFRNSSGNENGSIASNASVTAYNTSSDYRLKENELTISDAISKVKQLKPYTFNFKVTPDQKVDGFFAHEAQEVIPYAVLGEKDAEDMQQMDYGKLTPLLTAALQEAISEIETLKTEVAALKSQLNN